MAVGYMDPVVGCTVCPLSHFRWQRKLPPALLHPRHTYCFILLVHLVSPLPCPQVLDGFFEVDQAEGMADIYVWLRYSAARLLTWQRNYNTQPRILSAAQVGRHA